MMKFFKNLFFKKVIIKKFKLTGKTRVYVTGGFWGDAIYWRSFADRKVVGWKYRRPQKKDLLLTKLESRRTGVFYFSNIDYETDPPDMFFATVVDLGYLDEMPTICEFIKNSKSRNSDNCFLRDIQKLLPGS